MIRQGGLCVACWVVVLVASLIGPGSAAAAASAQDAASAEPVERTWLALGDSYSSGTGIEGVLPEPGTRDCRRAGNGDGTEGKPQAWPKGAYDAERVKEFGFTQQAFVACNGATTDAVRSQVAEARKGSGPRWDVVSFTFGGNNLGFGEVLKGCLDLFENWLEGAEPGCEVDQATLERQVDALTDITPSSEVGMTIPALLDYVADLLNPGGQVIVVGYPNLFGDASKRTRCAGVLAEDTVMIDEVIAKLNRRLDTLVTVLHAKHQEEKRVRITFVPPPKDFVDRGLCSDEPWFNGRILKSSPITGIDYISWYHPNQDGHNAIANAVAAKVDLQVDDTPNDVQQVDWRNRAYTSNCAGIEPSPITLTLTGGRASTGSDIGDHELSVLNVAVGDLTGDDVAEAAVLILCKPLGVSPNIYGVEAQVFSGDGLMLGGPLEARADVPGSSEYDSYLNGEPFRIDQARLLTGADFRTDGQCRACPPETRTLIWTWSPRTRSFSLN